MKLEANGDRINPEQELIDRMIDWRKLNRPEDVSDIKTNLNAKALHQALGRPCAADGSYPESVLYRGYRILAKARQKVASVSA